MGSAQLRAAYDRRTTSRAAALKVKNEGGRGSAFAAEHHAEFTQHMQEARTRVEQRRATRGQANRARRERVHVPTKKQTYWSALVPLGVVALYAFNHFVFNSLNPEKHAS